MQGRHIAVTGGLGALGRGVCAALEARGAILHVAPNPPELRLDDEAQAAAFFAGLPSLWASIHLAGGFAMSPVAETDSAALRRQIDMNFVSCFHCCRAAVKAMGKSGGRIVNVAARPGLEWRSGAGMTAYAASKAAVAALTVALAEEVAKDGILVNAVVPSIMNTPANRKAMPNADHSAWPKVEEVAATILFLASPDNAVTRGGLVPVFGRS
jgi:NAD(P)-dependent dehydrogenase (short-subunit alcohol dehydrogenase family)